MMQINELLKETMDAQASDLHLTVGRKPMLRVWGKLQPLEQHEVLTPEDTAQLAYSMLNAFQKQKFEKTWELDLSYGVPGLGRFRVNLYPQRGATGIAMRSISSTIPSLEELNLPPILRDLTHKPRGLVLVTGPTGHGKSTSLAAMIDTINSDRACHIVTVEDPIEYLHEHKKSNIIQLAQVIEAVVSMQLLSNQKFLARTGAGRAAGQRRAGTTTIARTFPTIEEVGRVPAVEIMIATPAIRNLIREAKTHQIESTLQTGAQYGMQTMDMALADLCRRGMVSVEDALSRAIHPEELRKLIRE